MDEEVRKSVKGVYDKFKDFEDDPAIPQAIRSSIKALKAIAESEEEEGERI